MCERRLVIEQFPDWAHSLIQQVLSARSDQPPLGAVEVVLEHRIYVPSPENEAALREALEAPRRLVGIRVAPEGEVALRRTLERRSVDELWASRRAWAVDALIVPIISAVLLGSCAWFVRRMRQTKRPEQLRLLGIVLTLDTLFIVAAVSPIGWLERIVGLAAALAVLLALIEVGIFAVARIRRWGVPTNTGVRSSGG